MKTVDCPWYGRGCHPAALAVPTLSLLFVLNRLTPFCNTHVWKFFSNSCLDYLNIWRHLQGLLSGDSPPPSFPLSFLLHWTLCEQANDCGSNWGTLARVTLWCVPKAPLPTVPQYLPPKRVRALLSSFPSFSLKLRTKPVKNCACTGQALKKPN